MMPVGVLASIFDQGRCTEDPGAESEGRLPDARRCGDVDANYKSRAHG